MSKLITYPVSRHALLLLPKISGILNGWAEPIFTVQLVVYKFDLETFCSWECLCLCIMYLLLRVHKNMLWSVPMSGSFSWWQECPESYHRSSTARGNELLLHLPRPPRWELADETDQSHHPSDRSIATYISRRPQLAWRDRLLPREVVRHSQGT